MSNKELNIIRIVSTVLIPFTVFSCIMSRSSLSKTTSIEDIANNITVQVLPNGEERAGSGVLVKKEYLDTTANYLVLTNAHVLGLDIGKNCGNRLVSKKIEIKTHDNKIHEANIHPKTKVLCKNRDLAILQFSSDLTNQYQIAKMGNIDNIKVGEKVSVSGFPCSSQCKNQKIEILSGNFQKLEEPRKLGYQIGYGTNVKVGMSGGAVITNQGKLIGINGKGRIDSSGISTEDDYLIQGFKRANPEEEKIIKANSWAIPSTAFSDILTPDSISFGKILDRIEEDNKKLEDKINKIYLMILLTVSFLSLLIMISSLFLIIKYMRFSAKNRSSH
jgi:S1-C subfamily serine protease